jgi:hypothetical protein
VTIAELKKAKDERPFQPFTLCMDDGSEIEVPHPDAVAWEDGSRQTVLVISSTGWEVVDVSLVQSLRFANEGGGK